MRSNSGDDGGLNVLESIQDDFLSRSLDLNPRDSTRLFAFPFVLQFTCLKVLCRLGQAQRLPDLLAKPYFCSGRYGSRMYSMRHVNLATPKLYEIRKLQDLAIKWINCHNTWYSIRTHRRGSLCLINTLSTLPLLQLLQYNF